MQYANTKNQEEEFSVTNTRNTSGYPTDLPSNLPHGVPNNGQVLSGDFPAAFQQSGQVMMMIVVSKEFGCHIFSS